MKKLIVLAFITCCFHAGFAQTWTGPASVVTGQVANYTFTNGIFYSSYSWSATDGNVTAQSQNGTTYSCTITWTTVGTGSVNFTGGGAQRGVLSVLVSCPTLATPNASFSYPNGTSICGSGAITYTGAPPTGVSWYWQTSSTGTSTTNSTNSFPVTASGTYYLRAHCGSTWGSAEATSAVTVKTIPVVTASTNPNCSGTSGGVVFTNNLPSTTDTWTSTSSNVTGNSNSSGVSASSSPYTFTLNETLTNTSNVNGTVTYTVTPSNNGCTGSAVQITTTVYPRPTLSLSSGSQTFCSGGTASATLTTNGVSGATYTWSYSGHSAISGASTPPTNATSFSQALTSGASIPVTGTYQVSGSANGCSSFTQPSISFNVNPVPTISLTNSLLTICDGSSTNISYWTPVSNATFTWGVSPSNVNGALAQTTPVSAGTISQTLSSQNGNGSGSVGYSVQSSATYANGGTCTSSNSTNVNVNPVPAISFSPGSQNICSGASANISLSTNGVSGASYNWSYSQTNASGASAPSTSSSSLSQPLSSTANVPGNVTYTVYSSASGCLEKPVKLTRVIRSKLTTFSGTN